MFGNEAVIEKHTYLSGRDDKEAYTHSTDETEEVVADTVSTDVLILCHLCVQTL